MDNYYLRNCIFTVPPQIIAVLVVWILQGSAGAERFTVIWLVLDILFAGYLVRAEIRRKNPYPSKASKAAQAAAEQQRREDSEILYWSGPFRQPEHDRVQLTAREEYVVMEWENAEREQIARMLGY